MSDGDINVSGVGFTGLLTIVFVILKLIGVIDWNWWWVISPILIGFGLFIVVMVCLLSIAAALSNW